jgi:hypothetical protein
MLPGSLRDRLFEHVYPACEEYLNGRLSVKLATEVVARRTIQRDGDPDLLWAFVLDCATACPEYQDQLVDLLVQLCRLPDVVTADGTPVLIHGMQVWRDLPLLGWQFRDGWNFPGPEDVTGVYSVSGVSIPERSVKFLNLNKFAALLFATEEAVFQSHFTFAESTLREALESKAYRAEQWNVLSTWLISAAFWIETAGQLLFDFDRSRKDATSDSNGPSKWRLWQERFIALSQRTDVLTAEVCAAAGEAGQMMDEIECRLIE